MAKDKSESSAEDKEITASAGQPTEKKEERDINAPTHFVNLDADILSAQTIDEIETVTIAKLNTLLAKAKDSGDNSLDHIAAKFAHTQRVGKNPRFELLSTIGGSKSEKLGNVQAAVKMLLEANTSTYSDKINNIIDEAMHIAKTDALPPPIPAEESKLEEQNDENDDEEMPKQKKVKLSRWKRLEERFMHTADITIKYGGITLGWLGRKLNIFGDEYLKPKR